VLGGWWGCGGGGVGRIEGVWGVDWGGMVGEEIRSRPVVNLRSFISFDSLLIFF